MTESKMIRDLMPIAGIPDKALKAMSRQQRYKLRRYSQGLCVSCGKADRSPKSRSLCPDCLAIQRERMRQRTGAGRRNLSSKSYVTSSPRSAAGKKAKQPTTSPAVSRKGPSLASKARPAR